MFSPNKVIIWLLLVTGFVLTPSSCLADAWDEAQSSSEKFIYEYGKLRQFDPDEVRDLVKALCDADEDAFDAVSHDVGYRIRDDVGRKFEDLQKLRDTANSALDKVLSDVTYKDRQNQARDYKDKIADLWRRIEEMTQSVRGGNHPVVSYMREAGQQAHSAYQNNSSYCTVSEWRTREGNADCIKADSCVVIEVKPNNSRAKDKGLEQARKYARSLNDNVDTDLISRNSDFRTCFDTKSFKGKVVTYTFCPEIDDEGKYKSLSLGWHGPDD